MAIGAPRWMEATLAQHLLSDRRDRFICHIEAEMTTFAPEFAAYWLSGQSSASDTKSDRREDDCATQEAELEALAERVSAARSVV
jgi:hypothetical protein